MGKLKSLGPLFFSPKVRTASLLWNHTGVYSNLPAPSVLALKIRGPRFMPNQSHTVILLLCFLLPRQPGNFPHFPQSMTSMNHQDCFTEHQSCRMMFRDDVPPSLEAMELLIAQKMPFSKESCFSSV